MNLNWSQTSEDTFAFDEAQIALPVCLPSTFVCLPTTKVNHSGDTSGIPLREDYEPPHDKTNKMACAPSEDSDQNLRCPHEESLDP